MAHVPNPMSHDARLQELVVPGDAGGTGGAGGGGGGGGNPPAAVDLWARSERKPAGAAFPNLPDAIVKFRDNLNKCAGTRLTAKQMAALNQTAPAGFELVQPSNGNTVILTSANVDKQVSKKCKGLGQHWPEHVAELLDAAAAVEHSEWRHNT